MFSRSVLKGEDMNNEMILKAKAEFFKEKDILVHISITGMRFYNGEIDSIDDKKIILIDEKLGELVVYFSEIKSIEPRGKKR